LLYENVCQADHRRGTTRREDGAPHVVSVAGFQDRMSYRYHCFEVTHRAILAIESWNFQSMGKPACSA
jgi:hypothetical protein